MITKEVVDRAGDQAMTVAMEVDHLVVVEEVSRSKTRTSQAAATAVRAATAEAQVATTNHPMTVAPVVVPPVVSGTGEITLQTRAVQAEAEVPAAINRSSSNKTVPPLGEASTSPPIQPRPDTCHLACPQAECKRLQTRSSSAASTGM